MLNKKGICAGIVTYNPEKELLNDCINSILNQVNEIFIFDNGSRNTFLLNDISLLSSKIKVIYNQNNIGIAAALNVLCSHAFKKGYAWILTLDQDSICDNSMVYNLSEYIDKNNYGIIAPRVEFWADNILLTSTKYPDREVYEIDACITSGSLTSIDAWYSVGGFDEWMFIDYVDNEFCTHIRIEGYRILRVNKALMYQRAGEMNYIKFKNGKVKLVTNYSPFRNYQISRNTIYYIRKYWKYINVKHEIAILLYRFFNKLIYEKNKLKTIITTINGIKDGFIKQI